MCENVIETFQLCKKHGSVFRVKDIHLAVPKGCIYGFLGPNGAGKTTTMKLILGLIQPSQGTIRILGKEVTSSNPAPEVSSKAPATMGTSPDRKTLKSSPDINRSLYPKSEKP